MKDYNDYLEIFDKKYNRELNEVEEKAFDKRLEEDEIFKVEFDNYMDMIDAMHYGAAATTKNELENIRQKLQAEGFFEEMEEEQKKTIKTSSVKKESSQLKKTIPITNKKRPWLLGVAASFLLLIGAYGFISTNYSNSALADTTSLYTARGVERGGEVVNSFEQGEEALENRQYKEAVAFFGSIPNSSGEYLEAQYFLAYAQYQLGNHQDAIDITSRMLQNSSVNIETRQKSEWLQIQSLLVSDQINDLKFKQLLNQIVTDEDHLFYNKAIDLEKHLNSFWRKLII